MENHHFIAIGKPSISIRAMYLYHGYVSHNCIWIYIHPAILSDQPTSKTVETSTGLSIGLDAASCGAAVTACEKAQEWQVAIAMVQQSIDP